MNAGCGMEDCEEREEKEKKGGVDLALGLVFFFSLSLFPHLTSSVSPSLGDRTRAQ